MQYKVFTVPVFDSEVIQEDLNKFLRANNIISIEKRIIVQDNKNYWSFLVEYILREGSVQAKAGRNTVDYKEILSDEEFLIYCKLRDIRNNTAKIMGHPPYTLYSNEQLAEIARKRPKSGEELQAIAGVGKAKADKYGDFVIKIIQENSEDKNEKDQ